MVYVETHARLVDGAVVPVIQEVQPSERVPAVQASKVVEQAAPPPPSMTAEVRRDLLDKLRLAFSIVATLPSGREMAWLGGNVLDVPEGMLRHSYSPAEISLANSLFDLILAIPDPFMRKVVTARLARAKWDTIRNFDPQRRSVRRLQQLHDEAINHMLVRLMTKAQNSVA